MNNKNLNTLIFETLRRELLEYIQPSFSVKVFKQISDSGNLDALNEYCQEHLNEKIGSGDARTVYDYTDDTVLKVAHFQKYENKITGDGRSQNKQEYQTFKMIGGNPLIPKIYDADTKNFNWLLTESVLPAKREDFLKILGISYAGEDIKDETWKPINPEDRWDYSDYENAEQPYRDPNEDDEDEGEISYLGFLAWYADYSHDYLDYTDDWSGYETEQYHKLMQTDWFQNLLELFEFQDPDEFFIENLGVAMRDGKPMIVVLDIGWDSDKM